MAINDPAEPSTIDPKNDPARFTTAWSTLFIDRTMTWFIKVFGALIIVAVFAILVFITLQALPLFGGAAVEHQRSIQVPTGETVALAIDEWGDLPALVRRDGTVAFVDGVGTKPPQVVDIGLGQGVAIASSSYYPRSQRVVVGTSDGSLALVDLGFSATSTMVDGKDFRSVSGSVKIASRLPIAAGGTAVAVAYGDSGGDKLAAAIVEPALAADAPVTAQRVVKAIALGQTRSMMGAGRITIHGEYDLTDRVTGIPDRVLVDDGAESVIVSTAQGEVFYFHRAGAEGFELRQRLVPFQDLSDQHLATLDFLLGDVSLIATNRAGVNRKFSLCVAPGETVRKYRLIAEFDPLPGPATCYAVSTRNKSFLLAGDGMVSLRHGTTVTTRWQDGADVRARLAVISGKSERFAVLDADDRVHLYHLDDPHPEAGIGAFFSRIWYEGGGGPEYKWQSSGSTDDFEPKLSMVPLIFGTIKGTFFAMIFAVPIALLAAVYTSEFMHPRYKTVIKPVVEIMSALPSVVLGFIAAIWLAPILDHRVPSLLMIALLVPIAAVVFGAVWTRMPPSTRTLIKPGYEWMAFVPLMIVVSIIGWSSGPLLEQLAFGGDFCQWWPRVTGASYQQRNAMVVGLMMGFAVIPIIFTIADDALSNVPRTLRSGSLALGASRWQTAFRVVLPTASPGIFSGLMIGLGRAIGETMIVVMATGNTAIMEWNPFSGMRTLSANIAVELPEATQHGTLYRTLFLSAVLLFVMTFIINTVAELLRQHLRDKYKTV